MAKSAATLPGDVQRIVGFEELPDSVREIPANYNPLADGLLMKHQRKWIADPSHLKIGEKGRRTGITFAEAEDDTITAASRKSAGGDNVYYIGDTKEKGLEFIGYCAHFAKIIARANMGKVITGIEEVMFNDQQPDGSSKQITSYRIRFASGFRIQALSSRPANIRGLQGIVVIDEAAFHPDVQGVIDAANALIIWGGKIRIISTHNGAQSPFNELIQDTRRGQYDYSIHHITFDDAVANGLYERVCLMKGWEATAEGKQDWYQRVRGTYGSNRAAMREELDAIPRDSSGTAIPNILIENCMKETRPVLRLALENEFALKSDAYRESHVKAWINDHLTPLLNSLDKDRQHFLGEDFARHGDFSIIAPMSIERDLTRRVPLIVEMKNVPTRQQEQILWHIIEHLPRFSQAAMDATGNGATIAEYTADKFGHMRIEQVMLSNAWYRENMLMFQEAFQDGMIDIPRDDDIRNDIRALQLIDGIIKLPSLRTQDTKNSEFKRHGDAAIALALAYYASKQDSVPIEFQSTGKHRAGHDAFNEHTGHGSNINNDTGFGTISGSNDFGGF